MSLYTDGVPFTPETGKSYRNINGRTYRCDPFAGRPLAYGDYLCALSDCAHDFADEEGAGVYVLLENGEPVPTTAAVAIVFPDGGSYAMIRPDTD